MSLKGLAQKIIGSEDDILPDALAVKKKKNADCFVYTRLTYLRGWKHTSVYPREAPRGGTWQPAAIGGSSQVPLSPPPGHGLLVFSLSEAAVFHLNVPGLCCLVCEMGLLLAHSRDAARQSTRAHTLARPRPCTHARAHTRYNC